MPASQKIKALLLETVYKKASRQAANILVDSPAPEIAELDVIAYKHMIGMFIPRAYEYIQQDWEWATGGPIPITMRQALAYYQNHVEERDS